MKIEELGLKYTDKDLKELRDAMAKDIFEKGKPYFTEEELEALIKEKLKT